MSNHIPDIPAPQSKVQSKFQNITLPSALSQAQSVVTSAADSIGLLQIGDEIVWATHTAVVYGLIDATSVKAYPPQTVASSSAYLRRNITVFVPPRAFLPENPVWKYSFSGYFAPFEKANKLVIRVSDDQIESYLKKKSDGSTIAFISDHGTNTTARDNVANLVLSWNPDALVMGGDTNYPSGGGGTISANNTPYLGLIADGKVFPAIGDHDYSGTSLTPYLNFFQPPGYSTPSNLTGNNGRYYSAKIGNYTEIFVVNAGWNVGLASSAEGVEFSTTLEPGGIDEDSDQRNWLQSALANSTATWKLVVVHFPPYMSANDQHSMPGYLALRWPFKEWGATTVFSGNVRAYERLVINGLTYFVGGWSGASSNATWKKPYSVGSVVRYQENAAADYGAIKLLATKDWLSIQAIALTSDSFQENIDEVTFWRDPNKQDFQNLAFATEPLEVSSELVLSQTVVRFNDTEYVSVGAQSIARQPRHEAEVYLLTSEDNRYRTFTALPFLPGNRRVLIFDRWLKNIRWYPHATQDATISREAAQKSIGTRPSQVVEVIPTVQFKADAEHWRQRAAQLQVSPCHERTLTHLDFEALPDVPYSHFNATRVSTIVGSQPVIFTAVGAVKFENLGIQAPSTQSRSQWLQVNFLVKTVTSWWRHARDWSLSKSTGEISVDSSGMVLPPPSSGNLAQLDTNIPTATWELNLPIGSYQLYWEWLDLNLNSVPFNVTVRWNGQIVFSGNWNVTPGEITNSPIVTLTSASPATGLLTLTLNNPVTPLGIKLRRFQIKMLNSGSTSDYKFNLAFYDTEAGNFTPLPIQYFRFIGYSNLSDVLCSGWLDIGDVGNRDFLKCELSMLNNPSIPIAINAVELRTKIKVDPISAWRDYSEFKENYLKNALAGIQAKFAAASFSEFRPGSSGNFGWTSDTTNTWLGLISVHEARLKLAFRPSRPGDIGRPTLVPTGVYFDGSNVVSNGLVTDCAPILSPWQPWMAELNFPVAMEDFWFVEEPARPAHLVIIDPTNEDAIFFDPLAPNLDFSRSSDSQYLTIAL
jgi:hypothetical protein